LHDEKVKPQAGLRAALPLRREMTDDEIAFLMVIGTALFALGFTLGFAGGYITRSAKSHRRRREAAGLRQR
jgi:hypothetical protein